VSEDRGSRAARASALLVGALGVEGLSSTDRGRRLDRRLFAAVNRGHGPGADAAMGSVTELGSLMASLGAAGALAAAGRRRAALGGAAAAATTWAVGQGMKRLYLRERPYDALPDTVRLLIGRPMGTSWPSSHPAVLLGFLTVAAAELGLSGSQRAILGALTGAVAVSRVYLGVHYPSDVVAGIMVGRAVGLAWLAGGRQVQ
jgi:membrane-associated phospholipid phosphatase